MKIDHWFMGSLDIGLWNSYFPNKNPSKFKHSNKIQISNSLPCRQIYDQLLQYNYNLCHRILIWSINVITHPNYDEQLNPYGYFTFLVS